MKPQKQDVFYDGEHRVKHTWKGQTFRAFGEFVIFSMIQSLMKSQGTHVTELFVLVSE